MPSNRRKTLCIQIEGENDEQATGDVWEEDSCEAIADGRPFNSETVAVAMATCKAISDSSSSFYFDLLRILIYNPKFVFLHEWHLLPPLHHYKLRLRKRRMITLTNEQFVEVVDKREARALGLMANKYEQRHEVAEFEAGDYYTIQVPKIALPVLQLLVYFAESFDVEVTFTRSRRSMVSYARVMQQKT